MTDGPALLRAILAHPAENAPRLVYADWLDENDDPDRAEFLRGQIRLSEMEPWDAGYAALDIRSRQLERAHPEWLGAVGKFVARSERFCGRREGPFERGFPARVKQTPGQFAKNARLFARNPLTSVRFEMSVWAGSGWTPRFSSAWLTRTDLGRLTAAEFCFMNDPARIAEVQNALARCRPLDHFGLVGCGRAAIDARATFVSPAVAGVRSLRIMGSRLTEETEAAFAAAAWPNLQRLDRVWISDLDWIRAPWVARLRELTVDDTEPNLDPARRRPLADILPETAVRTLRLGWWVLDVSGAQALGKAIARSHVRSLALAYTQNRLNVNRVLLTPKTLAGLKALHLSWAELDAEVVGRLAGAELRVCALDHVTCDALSGLAQRPGLSELTDLRLGLVWTRPDDPFGARLRAVLEAGTLPRLVSLSLSVTTPGFGTKAPHGDELAMAVAECPAASALRALHLRESVTQVGATALANSPHLSDLQLLDVQVWPKNAKAERLLVDRFGARVDLDLVGIEY